MQQDETRGLPDPEAGVPGGGRGRRDEVGGCGVYPASAGHAPPDAVTRPQAAWGQGDRGAAGYGDSGQSGLFFQPVQLGESDRPQPDDSAARRAEVGPTPGDDGQVPTRRPLTPGEASERRRRGWGGW